MKEILLLEDEDENFSRVLLSGFLESQGFSVVSTGSAAHALTSIESDKIELILLSFQLKEANGMELLRRIRARSPTPVIIVSNGIDTEKRIQAFDAGADDFIVKPFDPKEMISRIRAIMRRASAKGATHREENLVEYHFDRWCLKQASRELITPKGDSIPLTPAEFNLLAALVRSPMRVLSREQLLDSITSRDEAPIDRSVDVLVSRIRRKMETAAGNARYIQTVQSFGYRFSSPVTEA